MTKVVDIMVQVTGIILAIAGVAFLICVKINNETALTYSGITLLVTTGMFLAAWFINIASDYFIKN